MNNSLDKHKSGKKNIILAFIFIGLFTLDMIFKGQLYQRLPKDLQNIKIN